MINKVKETEAYHRAKALLLHRDLQPVSRCPVNLCKIKKHGVERGLWTLILLRSGLGSSGVWDGELAAFFPATPWL